MSIYYDFTKLYVLFTMILQNKYLINKYKTNIKRENIYLLINVF